MIMHCTYPQRRDASALLCEGASKPVRGGSARHRLLVEREDEPVPVSVVALADTLPVSVVLFYRPLGGGGGGESPWKQGDMARQGGGGGGGEGGGAMAVGAVYSASYSSSNDSEYYVRATLKGGVVLLWPPGAPNATQSVVHHSLQVAL